MIGEPIRKKSKPRPPVNARPPRKTGAPTKHRSFRPREMRHLDDVSICFRKNLKHSWCPFGLLQEPLTKGTLEQNTHIEIVVHNSRTQCGVPERVPSKNGRCDLFEGSSLLVWLLLSLKDKWTSSAVDLNSHGLASVGRSGDWTFAPLLFVFVETHTSHPSVPPKLQLAQGRLLQLLEVQEKKNERAPLHTV